jgi:hypothetical protein
MISIILCFWTERSEDTVFERICIAACVVSLMHAIRDIRFEFNYSGSQFLFLQWLSLANPVLPTEITICRLAPPLYRIVVIDRRNHKSTAVICGESNVPGNVDSS